MEIQCVNKIQIPKKELYVQKNEYNKKSKTQRNWSMTQRVQRSHNHHRHYHRSGTSKEKPPRYISGLRILKKASGKYNYKNKNWEWDKVTWRFDQSKNVYYSNRDYPNHFWNASNWKKSIKKKEQRNGAAGIILLRPEPRSGEYNVFVVQCYKNKFGFPKGKRNYEESFFTAALREFKEETGTQLTFEQKTFKRIEINSRYKDDEILNKYITKKIVFYVIEVPIDFQIRTKPEADVEITSFGWVPFKNLPFLFKLSKVAQSVYPLIEEYIALRRTPSGVHIALRRTHSLT